MLNPGNNLYIREQWEGGGGTGTSSSHLSLHLYINYMAGVQVECRGRLISALLYADDAESEEEMRVSLRVLSEWCREWLVELNVEKCGVMHA